MGAERILYPPAQTKFDVMAKLEGLFECGPIEFAGTPDALYDRHLLFDDIVDTAAAGPREREAGGGAANIFFAGKAAPAYQLAKVIIKFTENLAGTINGDPAMRGRLKVVFLPEYNVSLA